MKRTLLLIAIAALSLAGKISAENVAQALFADRSHDFGYIKEAKGPVSHTFVFENVGDKPLIVLSASTECGCTRPEYPTKPIKPGKKGKIKITYSPIGRPGAFMKTVKVKTNGKEKTTVLVIQGTVIPKK